MNTQHFVLQPFTKGGSVLPFSLTGAISRPGAYLTIIYNLTGPLQDLVITPPADEPARQWVLWESTCFEFFLATQEAVGYWEFNLSPAGPWNVFRLTGYRQGLEEEPAFQALPFTVHRQPEMLTLTLNVALAAILPADRPLKAAVSTVLHHQDGRLSYWALTHPDPEPDFHHPQGFVIKLRPSQ